MNLQFINRRTANKFIIISIFWLPVTGLSLLLIYNTIPYFSFSSSFSFIRERAILFLEPAYSFCFYVHIFAGMFCIGSALIQFSSYILKKRKPIHAMAGKVYVVVVLLLGAPTGLYMSFFAKGGNAERALFMFMAVAWFFFTLKGLTAILRKKIILHKQWMIRSYAMSLTAVSFRVYYLILYLYGVELMQNYMVSLWISVVGNMIAAEFIIWKRSRNYLASFTT